MQLLAKDDIAPTPTACIRPAGCPALDALVGVLRMLDGLGAVGAGDGHAASKRMFRCSFATANIRSLCSKASLVNKTCVLAWSHEGAGATLNANRN